MALTHRQYIKRVILNTFSRGLDTLVDNYFGIGAATTTYASELGYDGTDFYDYIVATWLGLFCILRNIKVEPGDAFLDVGCGRGRPLIAALQLPFEKVIGIDRSPEMINSCRANLARYLQSRPGDLKRIEIFSVDALAFDVPASVRWILLHCPFGEKTTREFFRKLSENSPTGTTRYIIAINPEHMSVLNDNFSVIVEKTWGGGWYAIYRIQK
jgi:cyclopropane fatty-acyl-phospholipid synthase-like methyltransferase